MKTKPPRKVRGRKTMLGKSFAWLMTLLIIVLAMVFAWQVRQYVQKPLLFAFCTAVATATLIGMIWGVRYWIIYADRFVAPTTIEKVESPH